MRFSMKFGEEFVGEREYLAKGTYQIGRGQHNAVCIKGPGFGDDGRFLAQPNATISRNHLEFVVEDDSLTLKDLKSSNGSYLDGERFSETEINSSGNHGLLLGSFPLEIRATD